MRLSAVLCLPILALAGCASIVDGTKQTVSVQTLSNGTSISDAQCMLKSNKGTWFTNTPGTVTVHRSFDALHVTCTKPGYQSGLATVASSTKGMAFGNILFGGVIGAGVDMASGAAYDYPNLITVPMTQVPASTAVSGNSPAAGAETRPVT
ncbi:MAG TPA: hypothetical protein VFN77_05825 [Acetobacteraceae bacterium]|nr:hypothetical protein [Acetobacteraceae bacterium]